ncbi:DUF4192 domain-containing protein [Streptomyces silvensis]|uniref:DUF4192 domain-containing protein n=1 Tax=Streptomyces silvensis TaxID=1765722 RepID=A0A0W7WRM8_9ACTN|nr:DUF4192 domain-containing protein [Streptomyces silvensis]KUF13128.1 hypothetical protein AT728_34025 [Streptomyces silvensis]
MTNHSESAEQSADTVVTLRTPAELADALPYLLGFQPEDSVVLIALHGPRGRFGGRVRLGIPDRAEDWPSVAEQLAQCLVSGCERRESRPDGIVAFLCREPGGPAGGTSGLAGDNSGLAGDASHGAGRQVMEHLRPLAQSLRTACGELDVPVLEVVCVSDGRFWTYCCPDQRCCPAEGAPLLPRGTSVLAAATAYAGHRMGPDQGALRARLSPWRSAAAAAQESALHAAAIALVPRILDEGGHDEIADETLGLARRLMDRLTEACPKPDLLEADLQDDQLLAHDEAAALILGLQDRTTRDRAAEWMEGPVATSALRLWRALARRCVGPFHEHAAAPLTLAGWVAWSLGDVIEGQEALTMALRADPHYTFALLLHPTCGADGDPEPIRRILRGERTQRESTPLADDLMTGAPAADGAGLPVGAASAAPPPVAPAPSVTAPTAPTTSITGSALSLPAGSSAVAEAEPAADGSPGAASPGRRRGPRPAARASRPAGGAGAAPRNRRPAARRDTRGNR